MGMYWNSWYGETASPDCFSLMNEIAVLDVQCRNAIMFACVYYRSINVSDSLILSGTGLYCRLVYDGETVFCCRKMVHCQWPFCSCFCKRVRKTVGGVDPAATAHAGYPPLSARSFVRLVRAKELVQVQGDLLWSEDVRINNSPLTFQAFLSISLPLKQHTAFNFIVWLHWWRCG